MTQCELRLMSVYASSLIQQQRSDFLTSDLQDAKLMYARETLCQFCNYFCTHIWFQTKQFFSFGLAIDAAAQEPSWNSVNNYYFFNLKKNSFKIQKQTESHWVFLFFFEAARFVPLLFNYGHYSLRTLFNHVQLKVHEGVIALLISFFFAGEPLGPEIWFTDMMKRIHKSSNVMIRINVDDPSSPVLSSPSPPLPSPPREGAIIVSKCLITCKTTWNLF